MTRAKLGKALAFTLTGLFLLPFVHHFLSHRASRLLPPTGRVVKHLPDHPIRAMWVWDARLALDSSGRNRLIRFCKRHDVDTLYLSAYDLRPPADEGYRRFNRLAHQAGISVHALAGDPRWGKSQYHHVPLAWMETVCRLNAQSPPEERFDGIHTDVEVYLLSKSWREEPQVLLGGYLDLNAQMEERLSQEGLVFGVDVPFWFDDDPAYRILWHGSVKMPTQHVLDTVDTITVMAYRNFAEGDNGTVHLVSSEMNYADRIGKPVVIGQETQENLYPAYVTFGGTSCKELYREMDKIRRVVGRHPSFGGFAVHHYESYRKLCGD